MDYYINSGKEKCTYGGVYGIYTEKFIYIGATTNLAKRLDTHWSLMRNGKHEYPILNEAFSRDEVGFVILDYCCDESLKGYETFWIEAIKDKIIFEELTVLNKKSGGIVKKTGHINTNQKGELNGNAIHTEFEIIKVKQMIANG